MAKWRVQYKAPDGSTGQAHVEMEEGKSAKEVREAIQDGNGTIWIAAEAILLVEKTER